MTATQLRSPDLGISYTGGLCLQAVREAFSVPAKYVRAIDDWNSGDRQTGTIPNGVAVPVYFSLGLEPAGHVAIRLPDGRIASSTQNGTHKGLYIHPDIKDLIAVYAKYNKSCTYLGWSTKVNDVPVVQLNQGVPIMSFRNYVLICYALFQPEVRFADTATSDKIINGHADYLASLKTKSGDTDIDAIKAWTRDFAAAGKGQKGALVQDGNEQFQKAKDALKALQQALS